MKTKLVFGLAVMLSMLGVIPFGKYATGDEVVKVSNEGVYKSLYDNDWEKLSLDNEKLNTLVRKILNVADYEPTEIDKFLVQDLNHDGSKDIIAAINQRCTSDPVLIVLIFKRQGEVYLQEFTTHWGGLTRDVEDLDEDGIFEIITYSVLAMSTDHASTIGWPTIYKWDNEKYVEASAEFPDYYRKFIEEIQRK